MTTYPKPASPEHSISKKNDLLSELCVEAVSINDLQHAKHNVQKQSNRQIAKCRASIGRYGLKRPVLITTDNEIIDGHAIVEAARQLGLTELPCIRVADLTDLEVRGLRIALNQIQKTGEFDLPKLTLELAYQLEFNTDLTDLGFDPPELDGLFETLPEEGSYPDLADQIASSIHSASPVTKVNDVWRAGNHLVACADMRNCGLLSKPLGEKPVDLVFADPPYNTKVNGHIRVGNSGFNEFAEASGEMSIEEFILFLIAFLKSVLSRLKPGGLIYCCMDWRHEWELHQAIRATGLELLNKCIWVKPNGGMGSFYRSRYETVFVLKKTGASHTNNVQLGSYGRYRTNVWEYAGATGGRADEADDFTLHPTVKPVRLVQDAILDASAVGQIVMDPFLGSGTTLLAAERTKRACIGLEISPAYVDVAIRRWQELTGKQATLLKTGQTYAERAAELAVGTDECAEPETLENDSGTEEIF
ncbi:Modification methylase DpnIIB [Ruegeria denitrificans]|uniref:Methyltransferase n=1 Tax=Ruegeria denitrificans TaxID=1715692 RepID=A0A0P1I0N2_9RHOB|nr:DNA methyltransferase [Ruegeria denitrificans]CUJ83414.1 Modification methylase DpnIIB [Ruegeria denitrificans]